MNNTHLRAFERAGRESDSRRAGDDVDVPRRGAKLAGGGALVGSGSGAASEERAERKRENISRLWQVNREANARKEMSMMMLSDARWKRALPKFSGDLCVRC